MKAIYTIADIDQGINFWRSKRPTNENAALCAEARALADHYGQMIFERRASIAAESLSQPARDALSQLTW